MAAMGEEAKFYAEEVHTRTVFPSQHKQSSLLLFWQDNGENTL